MKRLIRPLKSFGTLLLLAIALSSVARAADVSHPVILVASSEFEGSPFEQAVMVAAPLPSGGHIGFIVNKPTTMRLSTLFPNEAAVRKVTQPVYLGGPEMLPGVFALTRKAPEGAGTVVPLVPGLVAVLDGSTVDRVIASTPNDARYFLGVMLWDADELEDEVRHNAWEIRPADIDTVLPGNATGLWNSLHRQVASLEPHSRARTCVAWAVSAVTNVTCG
jgi:putative AlgH/UPF0301 family transcriptional regulator